MELGERVNKPYGFHLNRVIIRHNVFLFDSRWRAHDSVWELGELDDFLMAAPQLLSTRLMQFIRTEFAVHFARSIVNSCRNMHKFIIYIQRRESAAKITDA